MAEHRYKTRSYFTITAAAKSALFLILLERNNAVEHNLVIRAVRVHSLWAPLAYSLPNK